MPSCVLAGADFRNSLDTSVSKFYAAGNVTKDIHPDIPAPFYAPVSPDIVFANVPAELKRSDLEYTMAEIVSQGPNNTIARVTISLGDSQTKELLFGGPRKRPVLFLINLDSRIDRL